MTTWYLAVCAGCTPLLPQPFTAERDRDEWASVHTATTGHAVVCITERRDTAGGAGTGWTYLGDTDRGSALYTAPPGTPPPGGSPVVVHLAGPAGPCPSWLTPGLRHRHATATADVTCADCLHRLSGTLTALTAAALTATRDQLPDPVIECGPAVTDALNTAAAGPLPDGMPLETLYGIPVRYTRDLPVLWRLTSRGRPVQPQ